MTRNTIRPSFTYLSDEVECHDASSTHGGTRVIKYAGRAGVNTRSIQGSIGLPRHTLNAERGTLTLWLLSLEDLAVAAQYPHHNEHIPDHYIYPIIADVPSAQFRIRESIFAIGFETVWHPQFYAKWARGSFYQTLKSVTPSGSRQKAGICASHLSLRRHQWYQIALSWDVTCGAYRLYVNGILIGTQDRNARELTREKAGPAMYVGNPALCISKISFYDDVLSGQDIAGDFAEAQTQPSQELQEMLESIYVGKRRPFDWHPDANWREQMRLSLSRPEDLARFRIQGNTNAPRITSDGLRITTPLVCYPHDSMPELGENNRHIYLWTDRTFEGDLYIEYEFMPLSPGGLSLIMTNASGMQREDFLTDYPPSESDDMDYLFGRDIRNSHWEYYRDMNDVRNDCASFGLVKNPFYRPLGYACRPGRLAEHRWHTLQYLQEYDHIRCVINNDVVIEARDNAFDNNGPVLDFGRIAIRCMISTDLLIRNFGVWTRSSLP